MATVRACAVPPGYGRRAPRRRPESSSAAVARFDLEPGQRGADRIVAVIEHDVVGDTVLVQAIGNLVIRRILLLLGREITKPHAPRSEEHTSELQSLMRNSY